MIEGELVASSSADSMGFAAGERIFHDKFGYGQIAEIDGNKLTVDFDKAGRKRVVASFVTRSP
jgi:DNA helicase-2/ATP-dependent DNA helicase PcrA